MAQVKLYTTYIHIYNTLLRDLFPNEEIVEGNIMNNERKERFGVQVEREGWWLSIMWREYMRLASSGSAHSSLSSSRAHARLSAEAKGTWCTAHQLFLSHCQQKQKQPSSRRLFRRRCVCACECARQLERGHVDREEERVVASLLFAYCVCCRRALCYMLSARRDSTHSALSVIEEQSPGRQINWIRFSSRAELRRHSPLARASRY